MDDETKAWLATLKAHRPSDPAGWAHDAIAKLVALVERQEAELAAVVDAAHHVGWNGVENSKILAEYLKDLGRTIKDQEGELAELRDAVYQHWNQRADDRCYLDDDKLYTAFGLPPCDRRVGDKAAMLENCRRFIENRCESGGPWKSYSELEAENERLRASLQPFAAYADRVHEDADGRNPIDDACPPVGRWRSLTNAEPVPTLGDCRRAREALGRKEGT